ncbi:MAG: GNAT family N-acetyltransferase [Nocardioidaceae bacterium]
MTSDPAALLAAYDDQLREANELRTARHVQRHGPLWWGVFRGSFGFCTYRDLAGAEGAALDALIEATVAHFRDESEVPSFEWKTRGHDAPADLGERLVAHGLVAEDRETVMIGEAQLLAVDLPLPDGITLRRAGDGGDLVDDVERATAMQDDVFGQPSGMSNDDLVEALSAEPRLVELWLAEAGGRVVSAGRIDVVPGTDFAGIWGGATLAEWRGRGIYRALTAARARAALALGVRYINSDSTDMSRPILERSGLLAVTTTTPYVWHRP